jgi:hypothetical protein
MPRTSLPASTGRATGLTSPTDIAQVLRLLCTSSLAQVTSTAGRHGPACGGARSRPADDINPLDDSSPRGPGGHSQYRQPDTLLATAAAHEAAIAAAPPAPATPPAPIITAAADGRDLHITFDTHVENAAGLVVTVGDPHEPSPPTVHRIPIDTASGMISIPGATSDRPQTIHVSVATNDSAASPATGTLPTTN